MPLKQLWKHFIFCYLSYLKSQEIQYVLLVQRTLLKAKDILGHAVLYALHCKKTRPPTQVMQKAHRTGRRSRPETSAGKNPKQPWQLTGQRQLRTTWQKGTVKAQQLENSNLIWIFFPMYCLENLVGKVFLMVIHQLLMNYYYIVAIACIFLTKAEIHNLNEKGFSWTGSSEEVLTKKYFRCRNEPKPMKRNKSPFQTCSAQLSQDWAWCSYDCAWNQTTTIEEELTAQVALLWVLPVKNPSSNTDVQESFYLLHTKLGNIN